MGRDSQGAGLPAIVAVLLCLVASPATAQETVTLFATSLSTGTVHVFQGRVPDLQRVRTIAVGREPHNLAISPDGRWVATGNRRSGAVSLIDAATLTEAARIRVGRQPHDVVFSGDSRSLFVGQEQETFVTVIDVAGRAVRETLPIGRAQHDLALTPDGRELWFTVTNRPYTPGDRRVGVMDLATKQVTLVDTGANAHDVILGPDGRAAWVTNSGFIDRPDDRMHVLDVATRRVLEVLTVGRYPFHAPKRGRDGNYVPPTSPEMWFSDHGQRAVVAVSLADRRVTASVPVGAQPFHVTMTPLGVLFVANEASNTITIVDGPRRVALGTLAAPPRPHGVVVLVR